MKVVKVFHIPKGVFGYLNVLPNLEIWTIDYRTADWMPAHFLRPNLAEVPQINVEGPALSIKDLINSLMMVRGYYAILTRSHHLFGLAYSSKPFIDPKQNFVISL